MAKIKQPSKQITSKFIKQKLITIVCLCLLSLLMGNTVNAVGIHTSQQSNETKHDVHLAQVKADGANHNYDDDRSPQSLASIFSTLRLMTGISNLGQLYSNFNSKEISNIEKKREESLLQLKDTNRT